VRLLLDTHILLWWLSDNPTIPVQAEELIADSRNDVFVSPMNLWEIAIKSRLGKIVADVDEVHRASLEGGFRPLPFTLEHAAEVARLPDYHRDPFDRALVAQARLEPMHLVTHDEMVAAYGGSILLV
jgi:PIN domain nuclease of toxin-antitoxin system